MQVVSLEEGTYKQRVRSRVPPVTAELTAGIRIDGTPEDAWDVAFERFEVRGAGLPLRRRSVEGGGQWTHTYLDADTRVMRTKRKGGGGEFLFVLRRRA